MRISDWSSDVCSSDLEYVPALGRRRGERDDDVRQVLAGDRSRVRIVAYRPGDLALLRGRDALHRVTPTRGARERCVAVRSEERRVGKEGVSTCSFRWSRACQKKNKASNYSYSL